MNKKIFNRRDRILLLCTIILGGIAAALSAFGSILLQKIIDVAVNKDLGAFSNLFGIMLAYLFILGVMGFFESFCGKLLIRNVSKHLRKEIFQGVLSQDPVKYASKNTADYLSALVNDVKLIEENYLIPLLLSSQMIILFLTTLGILFYLSPIVTLVLLAFLVLMFVVPALIGRRMQKKQDAYSGKLAEFTAKAKDFLNGFEVIRSYTMYPYIHKKFEKINKETVEKKFAADAILAVNECLSDILSSLSVIVIVFVSAYLMLKGQITMGTLLALIQLSGTFVTPVVMLMQNVPKITSMKPVIRHLAELSKERQFYHSTDKKTEFKDCLVCSDVGFGYTEGQKVLDGVNMRIEKGRKYALLGGSGGGKSTLINLLTGYSKEFQGDITYDGKSVKTLDQNALNKMAAVIHQNVFMFDADIYENICLGEEFSKEDLDKALEDSGVLSFLLELEDGLYTKVGENGQNLSGGQRQRIAVARALIRHTPILIVDEGTSAVDRQTAYEIEKNILNQKNLTILVITHHMNKELEGCYDQIFLLENGKILKAN